MRKAVIDVGSNSVLLVVSEFRGGAWQQLVETSEVTGLGEGVKQTRRLGEEGMLRTLDALARAYAKAREMGAESVLAAATMAARIAENAVEFLERAERQGTPVFVLSGEREAELGFRAVANDPLFASCPVLSIVDPGGQSTEIVVAQREPASNIPWTVLFRKSFPIGTLALRSGLLCDETPTAEARLRATRDLDEAIGTIDVPETGTTVALGASATNLVTIRDRIACWDPSTVHGQTLLYEEVGRMAGWLSDMDDAGRAALVGIERGREKTIHIGALILERALFALRTGRCRVSVRGWRHALLEE